ncbi:MAG: glycosyltransferase family 4 protein [Vicinamibacterales bacterium]
MEASIQISYLVALLLAAGLSYVLTPLVRSLAPRIGALDEVDHRKIHREPIPRLGGLAVFASFVLALSLTLAFPHLPGLQGFMDARLPGARSLATILLPTVLILIVGIYDDIKGANAGQKLTIQALAGLVAFAMGFEVTILSNPFGDPFELGALSAVVTVGWLILTTNAVNLIDGMDGLAAGVSLFTAATVFLLSTFHERWDAAFYCAALAGALLGFLPYNFRPASIFLGDSGSLVLGFLLGLLAVVGATKGSAAIAIGVPLLALGIPMADTTLSVIRRAMRGRSIFEADQDHLHHRLLRLGLGVREAVLLLYGASAVFGLLSLLIINTTNEVAAPVVVVAAVVVWVVLRKLGYDEVRFRQVMRQIRARSRDKDALELVKVAERDLHEATTAGEFVAALNRLMSTAHVELQLTCEEQTLVAPASDNPATAVSVAPTSKDAVTLDALLRDGRRAALSLRPSDEVGHIFWLTVIGIANGTIKPGLVRFDMEQLCGTAATGSSILQFPGSDSFDVSA